LRIDNADERLTPLGHRVGLVSAQRWALFSRKQEHKARLMELLRRARAGSVAVPGVRLADGDRPSLLEWLRRPEASALLLAAWATAVLGEEPARGVLSNIEIEAKYGGYVLQQERQVERLRLAEGRAIPDQFEYSCLPGLSREVCGKLERVRPRTLGQAARIPGVTPAAIAVLDVYLSLGAPRPTA
jgi:tRNA uridine 5-carboxymethylaminomethyl modification enzyme